MRGSFAEHDFDAEPNRPDKAGDDHGDDGLEGVTLRLLDAPAPAPQVLKVRAQLDSVDQLEGSVVAVLDGLRRLAQPRSRMALAAAIRAGGVALVFRITATSTLSAVLVWLRASERISVTDLAIAGFFRLGRNVFARRSIGVTHHEIVGPRRRAKDDGGKVGVIAMAPRAADELNDLCAHEIPSHTAIATRPANASDIRYAVMQASLDRNQICGMTVFIRSFQARTLSPLRRPPADADDVRAACRRVRARRLTSRHDPDPKGRVSAKCEAVFLRNKREAFSRRSCPT
jgi:hypothetical protein